MIIMLGLMMLMTVINDQDDGDDDDAAMTMIIGGSIGFLSSHGGSRRTFQSNFPHTRFFSNMMTMMRKIRRMIMKIMLIIYI